VIVDRLADSKIRWKKQLALLTRCKRCRSTRLNPLDAAYAAI
jgi:hypothetical protein